jgi:hypothetical protein
MYSSVMVVNIYAHEFTEFPSPAKLSKLGHETRGVPCEADDSSVDVDDKGIWPIYFCASSQSNV